MALQLRRGTNAERLAITPQQGELIFVTDYLAVNITATTIVGSTDTLTFSAAHNLVGGQKLLYQGVTSFGLTTGTIYYVISTGSTTACKLSLTSGGTAVDLTDASAQTLIFNKAPTLANGTPVGNVSPLWIGNGTTIGGVSAQVNVLDDLLDVTLTSIQEGQTLYYDATTAQWKNTGIFTIDDTTNATNVNITTTDFNLLTRTNSNTDVMSPTLELRSTTTATPLAGFGSSINFSANNTANAIKQIGSIGVNYTDLGATAEDANFKVKLIKNGFTPLSPESTFLHQFRVESTGSIYTAKDLILNKDKEFNQPEITFSTTTKDGILNWLGGDGGRLFINGNFDVAGTGTNGTANITAGYGTTMGIANIFNNSGIGTVNLAYGATKLNLGGLTAGTTTLVKSPQLNLVGDILVGGNEIKTGIFDNQTDVWTNEQTAITLAGIDVTVEGELKVDGNKIKSSNADALTFSASDVTVVGDLTVGGSGVQSDIIASKSVGSLYIATPTIYVGTGSANTVVDIGGVNTLTTLREDVVVVGDLAVNGDNGGAYADITTTKNQAQLFPLNATTVKLAESATTISMGATTGTTTIRNNAVITGDATVNGGNINLNGVADGTTQPYITFQTQLDNNTQRYGIRGKSATDDAWFVGSGSAGDDLGYLEIATGDNIGGSNTGGQIYVRQYNNGSTAPLGVPWEGGTGTVVNTLTLLDDVGNTEIPNNLTVNNGTVLTNSGNVFLFNTNAHTVDAFAQATTIRLGNTTGTTTIRNDAVVTGNLTVNGTTTTVNSTTLTVDDKNIEMGSVASPTDTTAQGGGITLKGATDKTIIWNNATNGWELNQSVKIAGDLQINGGDFATGLLNNRLYANRQTTDTDIASRALVLKATSYTNQTTVATPQIGAGSALGFDAHTSTSGGVATHKEAAYITVNSTNITAGSEAFDMAFGLMDSGNTYANKLTLKSTGELKLVGDLTLGSNTIKSSNGTTAIQTTSTGDIIVGDDVFMRGSDLVFNYGVTSTTGNAGLVAYRYDTTAQTPTVLRWNETSDRWQFTNDGTNYTNMPVATDTPTYAGLSISNNTTDTLIGVTGVVANTVNDGDAWFVGGYSVGGATNAGAMVIATANNGTEPIFVRQYTGSSFTNVGSNSITTELKLLDASGNTTIPKILTVNGGDDDTAGLQTTGAISVGGNIYGYGTGGIYLDGSNLVLNNNTTGTPVDNAVITVDRGSSTNSTITWNEGTDSWDTSHRLNVGGDLTVNGSGYIYSSTNLALHLTGADVKVAGDLIVGGGDIKSANGTLALSLADTTGNVTVAGDLTIGADEIKANNGNTALQLNDVNVRVGGELTITGNKIRSSGGTAFPLGDIAVQLSGSNVEVVGDLTVTGNDIKSSSATALSLSGTDVTVAGDLTVTGNDIKSSTATALSLSGANVTVAGDLTVGGNDIKSANGTTALSLADTTGNVTVAGDLFVAGNTILSNGGYSNLQFTNSDVQVVGNLQVSGDNIKSATGDSALTLSGTNVTINGDLTLGGNDIKASNGATNITLTSNSLTTFAGDIKLGGNTVYDSAGNNALDFKSFSSIYGTSYQAKFNTNVNYGLSASYFLVDNMVEMNTSSLTTTSTSTAVLDYFDETSYRSAKYIVQISNGTAHQIWEGMMIHDGTNIFVSAYGDLRTTANNLATMSVGFNATTGHPELRVTPVNATQTKFKATKTYIAV